MAEDVLSRCISLLVETGQFQLLSGSRNQKMPSHVLFANDIMVFCRGSKKNLTVLMSLFASYEDAFGQQLSMDKCKYYAGLLSKRRIIDIAALLGFSQGALPLIYLGVPLFQGKPKVRHL